MRARNPASITDARLIPLRLDVGSDHDVAAAANSCGDVNVLINNAGVMRSSPILAEGSE
jgi:NADP-dependent 3-hydroxy acid dehydrogenase YdfG